MIHYTVSCDPLAHLYTVTMIFQAEEPGVEVMLPVWTPGSYLVREYSRHIQDFSCNNPWEKIAKNRWRIQTSVNAQVILTYRVYAHDLSVRTSHLDASHAYINGACIFLLYEPQRDQPHRVTLIPADLNWRVATALTMETDWIYRAENYDILVDSPIEMGIHTRYSFTVLDTLHHLVIWGRGVYSPEQIVADLSQIIRTTAQIFGTLPYPEYLFILHLADTYGGLEHHNCTSLLYPRMNMVGPKYERFLQLAAHEFFHLWNVKRIRPTTLDQFNYGQENYTSVLWFCEGATAYYDELLCYRCGFYPEDRYLQLLSEAITRLELTPGQTIQSLSSASFDAWIKLYRPDENSLNSTVSYYLKGHMVIWLLDLMLHDQGQGGMDQVMQTLWARGGAYREADLWQTIEAVAGLDLTEFYKKYIQGTDPLPYAMLLEPFGLQLTTHVDRLPYTGLRLQEEKPILRAVETDSPGQKAGLAPGDELVAWDGLRITLKQWPDLILMYPVGTPITVTFFRRDELLTTTLIPAPARVNQYRLVQMEHPTPQQQARYRAWLNY